MSDDHPSKVTFSERRLDDLVMPWLEELFDGDAIRGLAAEMADEAARRNPMREYLDGLGTQLKATLRRIDRAYELMEDPDFPIERATEQLHKYKQEAVVLEAKRAKAQEQTPNPVDAETLHQWLSDIGGVVGLLRDVGPADRREMLLDLGLRVEIERRGERSARLVASISPSRGVSGGVGGGT